jgi:signal transduction histidine kinase
MTAASPNPFHKAAHKKVLRVLMIEDDKYYFEFVKQLLVRRTNPKFELKRAASLQEAISHLQEEIPDVILLDLNLPDGNGLSSLAKVRESSANCPIVVLTSSDDNTLGLAAITSGAHDYLVKQNVGNDSLVRCIRYAIERRRSEEQTLRLAVIEDFIATLAHDMRVPLLGADKVLDALLSGTVGSLSEHQEQMIKVLKESNANQLELVHRLLEIYKYESGSQISLSAIDLPVLIEKSMARALLNYSGQIVFQNLLPKENSLIMGDEEALTILSSNLMDNATTFSDRDQPVTITVSRQGTKVLIDMHNFGLAIPQDVQDNLFQKFWHGVPGKRYVAHTGLGLYLCHRIVQLHRGRIACRSDEGTGTTFSVILPA